MGFRPVEIAHLRFVAGKIELDRRVGRLKVLASKTRVRRGLIPLVLWRRPNRRSFPTVPGSIL
jgi:hypothetical protein